MNEAGFKRDNHFVNTKNLSESTLSALDSAMTKIFYDEETPFNRLVLLEELSNTAQLLTEIHHTQFWAKSSYILPGVPGVFRQIVEKTGHDDFLFGKDLADKIRVAKAVAKIGKEYQSSSDFSANKIRPKSAHLKS